MNTTNDYLNALKSKIGAPSDYALAPKIGLTKQMISRYRNKKDYLSDEYCLKVASMLEIDPAIVLAAIHAERAKNEEEKRAWTAIFERLGGMAAAIVLTVGLSGAPAPVQASEVISSHNNVYYVKLHTRTKIIFKATNVIQLIFKLATAYLVVCD